MNYRCRTNIDEARRETWPTDFLTCPRVGDYVQARSGYRLKVVEITHGMRINRSMGHDDFEPYIEVELHR